MPDCKFTIVKHKAGNGIKNSLNTPLILEEDTSNNFEEIEMVKE